MKIVKALFGAAIAAAPLAAHAQPVNGLYISLGAGLNIMQSEPLTQLGALSLNNVNLNTNLGAVAVPAVGFGFGNGFRAELSFDYRYNGLDSLSGPGGSAKLSGSEQKFGPMVNLLYDFDLAWPVTPYVGAGVGYQWVRESINGGAQTEGGFAVQGILGVSYPLDNVAPGLALTGEYRFQALPEERNYGGVKFGNDYNHSILIGVRYAFGAAPAPVPVVPAVSPVPASPVSRSYIVFFDWDRAVLTDRARQIVSEAAANSTKVQTTRIEVNGYTDTSGTPQYNQSLSVRRAQVVAAELVRDGVPKNAISIQGFGEAHPLVPTGPNVREPQNRRVEIILK
ncbi:MAG TPA: OmpA family protein [Rhodopila sp.]|nr:OmpA family protein [Rhodopila sp.]